MAERTPYTSRVCTHFCGSGMPCRVGVKVDNMRDDEGRIPCVEVRGVTGVVGCDLMVMPPMPPAAQPGSMSRSLSALIDGRCPTCDQTIRGEAELDGRTVAMPCRHVIRSASVKEKSS